MGQPERKSNQEYDHCKFTINSRFEIPVLKNEFVSVGIHFLLLCNFGLEHNLSSLERTGISFLISTKCRREIYLFSNLASCYDYIW